MADIATVHQFMGAIGRQSSIVNLDPANDHTSYESALDIRELVKLEDVMKDDTLGPNGAVLYALEEVEHNLDWLEDRLSELGDDYVLFDCPGQVELYTHHNSLRNIFYRLQKIGYRMVAVHLSDSFCLTQPSLYISNILLALRAMLQMDLPHVNVLTKIDKVASYGPLPFNLDFYTIADDLSHLVPSLEEESPAGRSGKWKGLNQAVVNLVESYALVSFEVLAVEDKKSMMHLLKIIDRAGGYVFGPAEGANDTVWQVAMRNESSLEDDIDLQERWIDNKAAYDEEERRQEEQQAQYRAEQAQMQSHGADGLDALMEETEQPPARDSGIRVTRRNG
jgi:GPN-loop GTPase